MRAIGLTALAAVLFAGGFAFVRAQDDDLRTELAALERALADLQRAEVSTEYSIPDEPVELHRIPVITATSPLFFRNAPGDVEGYWSTLEGVHSGPGPTEDGGQPFGTIEEVAELLRVRDEQAGFNAPELMASGYELLFRGTAEAAARIRGYLENELRPRVLRTARFEVDWEMGAGRGDQSFRAQMLSLVGARGMFWVGRQQAIVRDSDVSPTFGPLGIVDPLVDRVYTGEWVLPELIGDGAVLQGPIRFESRRLDGALRSIATRRSGTLDMVSMRETVTRPNARLASNEWERVYAGAGVLRVRASVLERGAAR